MLTDEQIEALQKGLDEMELELDRELNLSDPTQLRQLCERAGLPDDIIKKAVGDCWDA